MTTDRQAKDDLVRSTNVSTLQASRHTSPPVMRSYKNTETTQVTEHEQMKLNSRGYFNIVIIRCFKDANSALNEMEDDHGW